jgi:uncharacterized damage-inducible protein DinB
MKFDLVKTISVLERTPIVFKSLLNGLSKDWTLQNEGENTWSPYDVIGHLVHGERTDWIPRISIILSDTENKTFEPYDRFAQFEMSKGRTLKELLNDFETLRKNNITYLRTRNLSEKEMALGGNHPELGPVTISQLLAAWVVHDLGHIAQVSRVMAKQYKEEVGPWPKYLTILNYTPKE